MYMTSQHRTKNEMESITNFRNRLIKCQKKKRFKTHARDF